MLAALRRARSLTQVALAGQLGVAQGEVSRVEHQTDLLLSTFARYVEAMGGDLAVVVRFGGHDMIELNLALADLGENGSLPDAAVQPDPVALAELAFYNGRYDYQEEKYFAQLAA
jgi:transcriptional regulator with XRE-family HTH domain